MGVIREEIMPAINNREKPLIVADSFHKSMKLKLKQKKNAR